jgi:hypothetical protein
LIVRGAINHEPSTINRFECQRTTDTAPDSALEIRHLQFPRTLSPSGSQQGATRGHSNFYNLQLGRISYRPSTTCPAQQGAEQDRPLFGSGHQPSTINNQPRTS